MIKQEWFVALDGQQHGPYTQPEVQAMASRGEVQGSTLVWRDGMADWGMVSAQPEFSELFQGQVRIAPAAGISRMHAAGIGNARALRALAAKVKSRARIFWILQIPFAASLVAYLAFSFSEFGGLTEEYLTPQAMEDSWQGFLLILTFLLGALAVSAVSWCLVVAGIWNVIDHDPRGRSPISPGMAVGLMFIPIFSCYWIFRVVAGATTELERRSMVYGVRLDLPKGLAIFSCIAYLPCISTYLFIPSIVTTAMAFSKLATCCEQFADAVDAAEQTHRI